MSFNSKYTGAQVEELLDKIPKANNIWHSGNFNPSNYLPLLGGTMIGNILLGGTTTNKIGTNIVDTTGGWQEFTHQNSNGYIALGPFNGSVAHIYTDRPSFYFNKDLYVNDAKVWHAGNDGSGSSLDADLLDGKQPNELNVASATKASQDEEGSNIVATYVKKTVLADWQYFQYRGTCSNINAQTLPGMYDYADASNAIAGTNYGILLCFYNRDFPTTWAWGVQVFFGDNNKFAYRTSIRKSGVWNNWVIVA